jgi:hypothetical protein
MNPIPKNGVGWKGILTALDMEKKVENSTRKFGGWRTRRDGGHESLIPASAHMPSRSGEISYLATPVVVS